MADPRIKKLKIQTGVIKRIAKEKVSYEKEAKDFEGQIKDMELRGEDIYVIKKRKECLQESLQMVPDCQKRLQEAVHVMEQYIHASNDISEAKEYIDAKEALDSVMSSNAITT